MSSQSVYRINSPSVIGEVLDGEAIIVNLDSGAYYSLDGAGAEAWAAAQAGATLVDMIDRTVVHFSGDPAVIAADVTALLAELLAENLLVAAGVSSGQAAAPVDTPPTTRAPFVKPILQKYTDMADLLLLDPIHEVEEQGWPHQAARV